jgi:hypothetical protein
MRSEKGSTPSPAGADAGNSARGNSHSLCYVNIAFGGGADFFYLIIGQLAARLKLASLHHIEAVVALCPDLKMIGVHANLVVALVPDKQAIGNSAFVNLIGNAMRALYFWIIGNYSIASGLLKSADPMPTSRRHFFNEFPKSLGYGNSRYSRVFFGLMLIPICFRAVIMALAKAAPDGLSFTEFALHKRAPK